MPRVYIVEDDEDIRELVIYALESKGYNTKGFEKGEDFFAAADKGDVPGLLLLDIMLPGEDGISILKKLRTVSQYKDLPVIMLTAKSSEMDKVKGLDMGADDYVTKPFSITELMSRINAILRRTGSKEVEHSILTFENIVMDTDAHTVTVDKEEITLTFMEFELLNYLLINKGTVVTRQKLMKAVWGYDYDVESRTLNMHIKTLRQKLGAGGEHIKTVRSVGYRIGE